MIIIIVILFLSLFVLDTWYMSDIEIYLTLW